MSIAFPSEIEIASGETSEGQSDFRELTLLSLVIPVRDAAATLPATLNAITRWIAESDVEAEVVVIDDGSSDGTRATASSFERRIANLQVLRHVESRGRLEAIRTGGGAASGELIAFGCADGLAASLEACPELMGRLLSGAEVAILAHPPERRMTPIPPRLRRGLADMCVHWFFRKISRSRHEPALVVCRASALKKMLIAARPDDGPDPDWSTLARRARCAVSVVSRGSPAEPSRPRPVRTA